MRVRYRSLPPVDGPAPRAVARELPADPTATEDCCGWLVDHGAVADVDRAREWLPFLYALDLAAETDDGYHRVTDEPTDAELRKSFRNRIYGADDLVAALAADDEPRAREDIERELARAIPADRFQRGDRGFDRETYVTRLVGWADRLGALESTGDGFRLSDPE